MYSYRRKTSSLEDFKNEEAGEEDVRRPEPPAGAVVARSDLSVYSEA